MVSSAKRGDVQLVAVVLDSLLMWHDSVALLDYGFANFNPADVKKISEEKISEVEEKNISAEKKFEVKENANQKSFFKMILNSIKNFFEKYLGINF